MAKQGEKSMNYDVPVELWEQWDEWCERQASLDKKLLGAWALYAFMHAFKLNEVQELTRRFRLWLKAGAPLPPDQPQEWEAPPEIPEALPEKAGAASTARPRMGKKTRRVG